MVVYSSVTAGADTTKDTQYPSVASALVNSAVSLDTFFSACCLSLVVELWWQMGKGLSNVAINRVQERQNCRQKNNN